MEGYGPTDPEIARRFGAATKYVATHRPESLGWRGSRALGGDLPAALRELKAEDGPTLLTQGSSEVVHAVLRYDLADELRLVVMPLVLGAGKRLFDPASAASAFALRSSTVSPRGAIIARYERAGAVETASFAFEEPTAAELERRARLT